MYSLLCLTASQKWTTGGMTTLIGLGMTFLVLGLLIGAIFLLRLILKYLEKNNPKFKEKLNHFFKKKVKEEKNISEEKEITDTVKEQDIDKETMAVIEQSVKKYVANTSNDDKPHDRIKIISVKEVAHD